MNKPFTINPWVLNSTNSKEALEAPFLSIIQNPTKESEIQLLWNDIDNAERYNIYINGRLVYTTSNLSIMHTFEKNGIYEIYVKAYDGATYSPSKRSNVINITIMSLQTYLIGNRKNLLMNMKKVIIAG